MNILEVLGMLIQLIYIAALIVGAVFSVRQKFMAGFYFFLILLVLDISKFFYAPAIDHWVSSGQTFGGWTIGQTISTIGIILNLLETAAFVILVIGLYRKWKERSIRTQEQ